MDLNEFYQQRISFFQTREEACLKKERRFPFLRLLLIILAGVTFYGLFSINLFFASALTFLLIVLFVFVTKWDARNTASKKKFQLLKTLNENEVSSLHGMHDFFPDGNQFKGQNSSFASDLDLFGNASLFHKINRTTLDKSGEVLADWLLHPADTDEIKDRNEAVSELKDQADWRQNIFTLGYSLHRKSNNATKSLINWLKNQGPSIFRKPFIMACSALSVLTIVSIILSFGFLPLYYPTVLLLIHFVIIFSTNTAVKICHQEVTNNAGILISYADIIGEIELQNFSSRKLISLKEMLETEGLSASKNIRKLSGILTNLDCRYNIYLHFFLNTLFFWDIHQVYQLKKWKKTNANIEQWFQCVGEFEALSCLANLSFNNPSWCFPVIHHGEFLLDAKKLGHPLITAPQRVCNDFRMQGPKIIILTGSNMSGKSTFLRTIGVNYVLALAGSCVCAEEYIFSHIPVASSMRIDDSLKDNTSSFYAELKKIASMIKMVETDEKRFLLLDEILRGTNSLDRHIGSKALIKQLIQNNVSGIIATHDLALTEMISEFPDRIDNYNFDIRIQNEELFFDYKLNKGVCTSRNASILMKKMGINI